MEVHSLPTFFSAEKIDPPTSPQNLTEEIFCGTLPPFLLCIKKSAQTSAPEPRRSQQIERLTDAVNHLADEARVVRDVMDEVREDLGWIARNGIPGRQDEHTQIVRMASDPLPSDANERLDVRSSTVESNGSPGFSPDAFDELVSAIAEVVTVVGQEQLNLLLTAVDDVRAKLVAAIKGSSPIPSADKESTAAPSSQASTSQAPATPSETRRLF